MNDQQAEAYGSDTHERKLAVMARLTRLENVETRLRKLNIALANIAVSEKPMQLKLIRSARRYIEERIKPEPVQGITTDLRILDNELQSMYEGLVANTVTMSDLVLVNGVRALNNVQTMLSAGRHRLKQLESAADPHADSAEREIKEAQEVMSKIPPFENRDFLVWRCPVSFSGTDGSSSKFSKVGYLNTDKLDHLGFTAASIGGYTVLKKQLCIGINPKTLMREVDALDEDGNQIFEADGTTPKKAFKRRTVKETVQKSKAGKPVKVVQRRERTAHDEALEVMKMMEAKTGTSYTLISPKPASFDGGTWFWCMSSADVQRLSRAFPGGRIDIQKWGFAGQHTATPVNEKPHFTRPQDRPGYKAI